MAGSCLRKHIRNLDPGTLWDQAVTAGTTHSQLLLLSVLRQLSRWDHLERLLHAIITSESTREKAIKELGVWNEVFNRSSTALPTTQRPTLIALLDRARPFLVPEMVREVEFVLK